MIFYGNKKMTSFVIYIYTKMFDIKYYNNLKKIEIFFDKVKSRHLSVNEMFECMTCDICNKEDELKFLKLFDNVDKKMFGFKRGPVRA